MSHVMHSLSLGAAVQRLVPSTVQVELSVGEAIEPELLPEEAQCVARAVAKRRREFAIGRACARKALEPFGHKRYPLVTLPNRGPAWPDGIVGSITHCDGLTAAAVGERRHLVGIGMDAEPATPLDSDLRDLVLTSPERQWISRTASPPAGNWAKVLFSVKESIHKCINPSSGFMLDFRDVSIFLDPKGRLRATLETPHESPVPPLEMIECRFETTQNHILTSAIWKPGRL